jgi:hypothetical protein
MQNIKSSLISLIIPVSIFLAISIAYMSPALSGKNINQHDITQHKGQSKELVDYREKTGGEAIWTNSMFGGMPGYMISTKFDGNKLAFVHRILVLGGWRPISFIFLYLIVFYISLLAFKINRWLAIAGAIAYAFASYQIIIIVAGHNSKVYALAYLPAIIGGIHLAFHGKYLWGGLLAGIALGLQIFVIHLQITYYTLIIVLIYGLFELIYAVREQRLKQFGTAMGVLLLAVMLAVGSNLSNLLTTVEYGRYSIRGKSDLSTEAENRTSGLDKDYATDWSYGISETFTLLIPNFMGGASAGELPQDSETYKFLSQVQGKAAAKKSIQRMPTYWGDVQFTAGPVYVGAIICFLFVLGLFIVDKKYRWWLLVATIVSFFLAWGRNVPNLTNFLLDHLPGYNKFRAVSMTLVIAGFTMPLLAMLAVDKLLKKDIEKQELLKGLKWSFGITGGLTLFLFLFGKSMFSFEALSDEQYLAQGYTEFVDALQADRASLLRRDAFRSFIFISLAAGVVYAFIIDKLKALQAIAAIGVLILVDLWSVDKRYLNKDDFVSQKKYDNPFTPSIADNAILQDKDLSYRVLNMSLSTFNDASTSYFHKSIGGYHGAKMRRYQEIIEANLQPEMNDIIDALRTGDMLGVNQVLENNHVMNMLNTRYIIYNPSAAPLGNRAANGNAWFVSDVKMVDNADEEIAALGQINTKTTAVVDKRFEKQLTGFVPATDSLATLELTEYEPNYLKYQAKTGTDQVAVFSEIYYSKGWTATIDGEPAEHFRANYVLRAMVVPAGEHTIEFSFKPQSYFMGEKIALASSLVFLLLLLGGIVFEVRKGLRKED